MTVPTIGAPRAHGHLAVLVVLGLGVASSECRAQPGVWTPARPMPEVSVHACNVPGGKVVMMGFRGNQTYLFDPETEVFAPIFVTEHMFCSGHAGLATGELLVTGGGLLDPIGVKECTRFDPVSRTWTRIPDSVYARWYPTATTMPDGRVFVASGKDENGFVVQVPEVYDPVSDTWTELPSATRGFGLYPFHFLLPNGRIIDAGRRTAMLNPATWTWQSGVVSSLPGGCAVMYEPGLVMKSGGDGSTQYLAIADTWVADFTEGLARFTATAPMHHPRRRHNLTILPDGTVFCSGGTRVGNDRNEAVYPTELWDPTTLAWTLKPPISVARMYHSIGLLLRDGRVLSSGGNEMRTYQIYSPGYLFRGPRPVVHEAPSAVDYTGTFPVRTEPGTVARVSLIRHGAVTHAFDQNQRFLWLNFTENNGLLTVELPPGPNHAPPGGYMLFLLTADGVPSIGHDLRLSLDDVCVPDFDDNHYLDVFDFLAFQNAFAAGHPRADLDQGSGVGVFDVFDFLAFQNLFGAGCPN